MCGGDRLGLAARIAVMPSTIDVQPVAATVSG
jgi:hypothetical protein